MLVRNSLIASAALVSFALSPARCPGQVTASDHRIYVQHQPVSITGGNSSLRRRVRSPSWDTTLLVAPRIVNQLPGRTYRMRASRDIVAVSDERGNVLAFDRVGKQRWFRSLTDGRYVNGMAVRSDTVWLLDRAEPQFTLLTSGTAATSVRLSRAGTLAGFLPLASGDIVGCESGEVPPCTAFANNGRWDAQLPFIWQDIRKLNRLGRASVLASDPESDQWVYAFSMGDGWLAFKHADAMPFVGAFIEHHEFPDIIVDSTRGSITAKLGSFRTFVLDLAVSRGTMTVLFKSDDGHKYLDQYDLATGAYRGSLPADPQTTKISIIGDTYYLLLSSPLRLVGLRERAGRRKSAGP